MSGAAILTLTRAAEADRIRRICADLAGAVADGDLGRIAALDHALRNGVMAMLGGGAPRHAADLSALTEALAALDAAVRALRVLQGGARGRRGARAIYVAAGRPGAGT